ncbi:glycosyltransferase family 4 protein [Streptosporangium canum]|uniref:glycosyltransferase family 4 protein n=1 Tax=Streptosporangium canum TaxID=324952 RepID=UPI003679E9F5
MNFNQVGVTDVINGKVGQGRIFHTNIWFKSVNNARYESLLPYLGRVDNLLLVCSDRRILRGLQFRALNSTIGLHGRALFGMAARAYRYGFITNARHLPYVGFPVVVDMDDPFFTEREVSALRSCRHVAALVVTNEAAAARYRELGLTCPIHVVGHGLRPFEIDPAVARKMRERKRPGELTVGYVAAWHLAGTDRGSDALYNVDHLIDELWPAVVAACPRARLWLVGGVGRALGRKLEHRQDVELVGHVPAEQVPACMAAFDVGIYPRRIAHERSSIKVAQSVACGVPVVGYRGVPTELISRLECGLTVDSADDFTAALVRLLDDGPLRASLSARARAAAGQVDWDVLGDTYVRLLDDVFPIRDRRVR